MTLSSTSQKWLDKIGILSVLGLAVAVTLGVKQVVTRLRRRK